MGPPESGPPTWRGRWGVLRRRPTMLALAALCTAALVLALTLWWTARPDRQELSSVDVEAAVAEALNAGTPAPAVAAQVYRAILPSLVVVQTDNPDQEKAFGIGSGVVINSDAEVLTSLHVVEGSTMIELIFADGARSPAAVTNADPEKDIAVLTPAVLPQVVLPATIGNSGALRVGDEVFAVGHPLGLVGSLSAGVVSGLDRESTPPGREEALRGLIQFDAAVNPGSSGGPLLDRRGQVVGIVTGLINPGDDDVFIGIGFAVPIDVAVSAAGGPAR